MNDVKPERVVSTLMLMLMVVVSVMIMGLIFAFIVFYSGLDLVGMALWIGVIAIIFAIVVYFVHAIFDDPVTLALCGGFAMLGLLSFYAAIFISSAKPGDKMIYIAVLSIFVLIFLIFAYRMRSYGERQKERIAKRKHMGK